MKMLVLGKNGQIGWELRRTLLPLGEIVAFDVPDLDLTRPKEIRKAISEIKPQVIINAAAYTFVDQAESEHDLAMAINGHAPGILAEEAKKCGALLVHYSTDYVFDGMKSTPYTEDDQLNPINFYGQSKLAGERAIQEVDHPFLIFRTSWIYGLRGKNFFLTMLRLAKERREIQVVDDQTGSPTWSRLIAGVTGQVLGKLNLGLPDDLVREKQYSGLYHLTASGCCSWFDFSKEIIKKMADHELPPLNQNLAAPKPVSSEEYLTAAKRPHNSRLDCQRLMETFNLQLPDWQTCLDLVMGGHPNAK